MTAGNADHSRQGRLNSFAGFCDLRRVLLCAMDFPHLFVYALDQTSATVPRELKQCEEIGNRQPSRFVDC